MKQKSPNNKIASLTLRITQSGILLGFLLTGYFAYTDYVGTLTNRIFLDPESIPAVTNGYDNGDIVSYIAESTPAFTGSEVGAGAWNTLYVPPGVRVIGAEVVIPNGDGTYSPIAPQPISDISDGCGNRGCAFPVTGNIQNGKLNENQQDVGIFYSTDSRTALLGMPQSVSPTGTKDKPQDVWNEWDYQQILAFGAGSPTALSANDGKGNTPVVDTALSGGGGSAVWAGTGSPVAGPLTYFSNDYSPVACPSGTNDSVFDAGDLLCVGPWQRISYIGSSMGGSGPVAPTILDPGIKQNTAVATSLGHNLSASNPLPANTNAIRYVLGERRIGELETVRVTFEITDAVAFTTSLTTSDFCFDATGGDTDKDGASPTGRGAQDNIWRYYEGNNHFCFDGNANADLFKTPTTVDGEPFAGTATANSVIGYTMTLTNTGNMMLFDINFTDTPPNPDLVLLDEGANALCPYPSYDGNYTGSTPAFSGINTVTNTATWAELDSLGQGESVTLFLCAQIAGGANFGDAFANSISIGYAIADGGPVQPVLNSTSSLVVSTMISGTVYLDRDQSGTESAGDTGIGNVFVELYDDVDASGTLTVLDTFIKSVTTNSMGLYSFIGQAPGDYVIVETGLSGLANTADADTPLGSCGSGNACNEIGLTLVNDQNSVNNNFYNIGATIGDFIWIDTNEDGVQDVGENGVDGVTVDLYLDNGIIGTYESGIDTLIDTQTTTGGGVYDFEGVSTGNYIVDVTDTAGTISGYSHTTGNDPLAVNISTPGQDFNDADFGYVLMADLAVTKTDTDPSVSTYTPGSTGSYTITVSNNGTGDVVGATLVDNFPNGFTASWTCDADAISSCVSGSSSGTDITTAQSGNINQLLDLQSGATIIFTVTGTFSSDMNDYTP